MNAQTAHVSSTLKDFPEEKIKVTAHSNILFSGQVLYYQTTCYANIVNQAISDIAYVELVSNTKDVVFKHKLVLTDGRAYGDHFLSTQLKTGHYKLIAYTEWSLNNLNSGYDQVDLYIINPYLDAAQNNLKTDFDEGAEFIELSRGPDFKLPNTDGYGLNIKTDSKIYNSRSKVTLQLQNSLKQLNGGAYTIVVKRIDSVQVQKNNIKNTNSDKTIRELHLPEMRGELIQGQVVNTKTKMPAAEQVVSLSIPGEIPIYKSTSTNDHGKFFFNLYEPYDTEKGLIQVVGDSRDEFEINIDTKSFNFYDELKFYPLKLNTSLKELIENNSFYNQVESAYYDIKKDSLYQKPKVKPFYGQPDIVYVLDDYNRFPSIKETFVEVVQNAAIRQSNNQYRFLVYDYDYPFGGIYQNVKPLLLMDGIQIQDENRIINYDPKLVESVSLVKGIYSIGSEKYNGVIDIKSKKQTELSLPGSYAQILNSQMPEAKKRYFRQNYNQNYDRIPDLRTQLLWEPNLDLDADIKTLEFYTSDLPGFYIVEFNGLSHDGKSIYLTDFFEVTNNSN